MLCVQCKNRNPVGNKFCRECGTSLAAPLNVLAVEEAARAERERAQEQAARLLTDAHLFADQNKLEHALLLAQEAAERMPHSTSAFSLLAALQERAGAKDKAIAAMEQVVALNPSSEADRKTLDRLKHGEASGAALRIAHATTPAMSRPTAAQTIWLPVLAASMVGAFVLGVGLSVVKSPAPPRVTGGSANPNIPQTQTAQVPPATQTGSTSSGAPLSPAASNGATAAPGAIAGSKISMPPPADASTDPFASQGVAPAAASPRTATTGVPAGLSAAASSLPLPGRFTGNASSRPFTLGPAPVKLVGVPTGSVPGRPTNPEPYGQGVRIAAAPPAPAFNENSTSLSPMTDPAAAPGTATQARGNGYIRISVRSPQAGNSGAIAARTPQAGSPGADPMRRAQSLQGANQYAEAVGAYQAAASADPGSAGEAYQGMGLSYQRLGDDGNARAAYRKAIAAYEAEQSAGRGSGSAARGIASCKAALEVLGG
ncbi:MAG: hypothetical protein H7Z41_03925 [Cytophagales bacterium]|nr:hypothetical protein [Armatimonadota bacterium]